MLTASGVCEDARHSPSIIKSDRRIYIMKTVSIYKDNTWVGSGPIRNCCIECTANLGDNGNCGMETYIAIESEIAAGAVSGAVDGYEFFVEEEEETFII